MFPGAGIVRGWGVTNFLNSMVNGLTFDDTMIPVKIVASDLDTIEEVVFERGKLIDAIRASISIPGIFRPVMHEGRTLIDGGLASPVPVDVLVRAGISQDHRGQYVSQCGDDAGNTGMPRPNAE